VRRWLVAVAALALVGCGGGESGVTGRQNVRAADFVFVPATVRVHVGDTVEWRNSGATDHSVKGPGFFSRAIAPGARFQRRFDRAGSYAYLCTLHPDSMRGRVVVEE
jgi:plastocyanin